MTARRTSIFRPCIDLHHGTVKQIVGGSLRDAHDGTGDDAAALRTNFVATHSAAYYARLYAQHDLRGGHVIKLGPGNDEAAAEAVAAWPNRLHVGGGITVDNAAQWIERGAEKVIVTSYLFPECRFSLERLVALEQLVGRDRLVVDISCRRRGDEWVVAMNRWQDLTDMVLSQALQVRWPAHPSELLIHAADVEGLCRGIDEELVRRTCAADLTCRPRRVDDDPDDVRGRRERWVCLLILDISDMRLVDTLSQGRVDLTFGSALDIFGGTGVTLDALVQWNHSA